jgi:hypothetical protein
VDAVFPVKLITQRTAVEGEVRDLSRTGIRLRVLATALGAGHPADVHEAGRLVAAALDESFEVHLHHRRLGSLVPRGVRVVRVGLPPDEPGSLELCCDFGAPLGDEEAGVLQVDLPHIDPDVVVPEVTLAEPVAGEMSFDGESDDEAQPPSRCDEPPAPLRAFVSTTMRAGPPSAFCRTDMVTSIAVRVRFPRRLGLASRSADAFSASGAASRFVERFGDVVDLRLVASEGDVWSGPVRVSGVELPDDAPEVMLVTLAFDRPLRNAEARSLGLECEAA